MPAVLERRAGIPQLVLLLAGSCLSVLGAVLIAPVLPQMTGHFADVPGADVLVPIVLTVPALIIGLTAPFAGFIADRIDRKRVLILAMIGYTIFGTAPLYLESLGAIIGSRVLVGLCEAAIMTCCTTLIADYWSGPRRSRYLGLQTLLASVSATVFLGVGGALGSSGWRTPFWLYLAAALLAVPMALLIWQPARSSEPGAALPPIPWRQLRMPCLVTLAGGIAFYALIVELSFVLDEAGVTATATIGALSALMSLATAIAAGSFAKLSGRTPRDLLPIAFGLAAAGFLIIWSSGSVAVITAGAVLTGAGTGLLLPVLATWATNGLSFSERGRGTGLWTGSLFIGQFLSPVLITGIAGAVGGLRPALGVLGILTAILAVTTLVIVPRDAKPLNITND
ncbi:MFS transporter [Actinoplanes utahensis]|uniref:MFS transporter n=1 Tax=Actinoplanes utahensis TaxID=1869 RepID=UPI00194F148A|nr:MFS transporter [Actinoplanes utahensis]GIF35129.1 MFS transporter [Actinoplanes utahensis]